MEDTPRPQSELVSDSEPRQRRSPDPEESDELIARLLASNDPHDVQKIERILAHASLESSTGPYPPPGFVQKYNEMGENLGNEVLKAGIERVRANTQIDLEESRSRQRIDERGQYMAFAIVVVMFFVCTLMIFTGHEWAGLSLAAILIVSLAIVFIGSSRIDAVTAKLFNTQRGPEHVEGASDPE